MTSQHVNQEMIDAYYEYTHLTLDRRKFANKLREMAEADSQSRTIVLEADWVDLRLDTENKLPQ
jgi:hypothetical protein